MNNHIKTSHGIAIIGTCFLITLFFINWAGRQIDSYVLSVPISPSSQIAAVSGAGSGLVAHYTFDDGTANDSSGNSNHGTINGATAVAGKVGSGALEFDGVDDYVIQSSSLPSIDNYPYTMSVWVKSSDANGHIVFGGRKDTSQRHASLEHASGFITLCARDFNSPCNGVTSDVSADSQWHHVVGIYSNSTHRELFVDGVSKGVNTNEILDAQFDHSSAVFVVGRRNNSSPTNYLEGIVDDVRIYNRALTADEVSELFNNHNTNIETQLDVTIPSTPTNLSAEAVSSSEINLLWDASSDNIGVVSYQLERCQGLSCSNFIQINYSGGISYNDANLVESTIYNYRIRAVDAIGNFSSYSKIVSVTTNSSQKLPNQGDMCTSITQFGISWIFDKSYRCGQFASGEWWVLAPVIITRITPDFSNGNNGWEVNPKVRNEQGFQSNGPNYNSLLIPALPYTASTNQSVVKVIGGGVSPSVVQQAAVLTVLTSIPPDNGASVFRPPYIGDAKPLYSVSSLRTDLLPSYPSTGNPPSLQSIVDNFSRGLRMDHNLKRPREFRPTSAMENYQPKNTQDLNNTILRLMLNDSVSAKMPALIQFTQHAIDQAYAILGGYDRFDNGHNPNHRIVAGWAAVMLDMNEVKNKLMTISNQHEEYYVRKPGNVALWGEPNTVDHYWDYIMGLGGSRSNADPYGHIDGGKLSSVGASYQNITAQAHKGEMLAAVLMPELQVSFNSNHWPIFKEYVERWVNHGVWAQPDPCAPYDGNLSNYSKTFGPDSTNPSQCIKGSGRFSQYDGANADGGQYKSSFVAAMWDAYANSTPVTPTNLAPTVSAGSDKSVALPQSVSLQGTATDDNLPLNSTLSVSWSKVSGPPSSPSGQAGTVTFANPSSAITTATFSRQGTYILRLTATDGSLSATDDVTITVTRANPTVSITSPHAGTQITLNTPVPVTVSASPPTGFTLSSVKLYDRNTLISTKTSSPWTFSFTPTTPGIHTLKATAEDNGGASTDSSPISLTVASTPATSDADQDGVPNSLDLCPKTIPPARAHVDTKGCPTPKADNFSIKPNWNTISSLISAPSLELGILNLGKVTLQRQQGILLVKSTQDSDDRLDFDSHLSFSQNKVTANPTELPLFSEPTTITLYNIDEIQPKILKDGTECSDCTITSYQDNTLIFTVPHFSTYEITEGYINPPNAPEPARTTGGGGGGGGRRLSTTSSATPATPTLCLPGYLFHPATGQRCSTQAQSIPGCLPNYLFSPITGQLCSLPASPRQSSTGATAGFPTANFTRDLALGSRGEDVRNLQIFLNTQGFTVSNQGVGSKGNETDYFGPATHSAVIRFQNYYRDDILTPVGLRSGTGYFGPSTMRKVNVLLVQ